MMKGLLVLLLSFQAQAFAPVSVVRQQQQQRAIDTALFGKWEDSHEVARLLAGYRDMPPEVWQHLFAGDKEKATEAAQKLVDKAVQNKALKEPKDKESLEGLLKIIAELPKPGTAAKN